MNVRVLTCKNVHKICEKRHLNVISSISKRHFSIDKKRLRFKKRKKKKEKLNFFDRCGIISCTSILYFASSTSLGLRYLFLVPEARCIRTWQEFLRVESRINCLEISWKSGRNGIRTFASTRVNFFFSFFFQINFTINF